MATPSNMPAYAQSNAAAAAAAKAEAAKLAAVKKATPVPTPTPVIKPASAPAPSATVKPAVLQNVSIPPKANVPPIPTPQPTPSLVAGAAQKPAGMPAYAISNEAAMKNSLANTYDTAAADAKAKNDALAKAFKETVAPQTDSIIRSVASNPIETDEQKRARLLKDGSVAIRARSMTPEQQKATWGIVIDFSGGQQIASQPPEQAKPDAPFLTPTFQAPQTLTPTVAPTPQMPVYATGDVNKIKDYTASNVSPMTTAEQQKAFIDAVNTRADVLNSLEGSRIVPASSTATQNQAVQDVLNNLGVAQGRTSVSPSTEQPAGVLLGAQPVSATPSNIIPSGAALGEAAKSQSEAAKAFIDKLVEQTYGTSPKDVFATSGVEKPVVKNEVLPPVEKKVEQPPVEKKAITPPTEQYTYGQQSIEGKRWIPNLGWVTPEVFNQSEANNKSIADTLSAYKQAAAVSPSVVDKKVDTQPLVQDKTGTTSTPKYGDTNEKGQRWIDGLGWVEKGIFDQAEQNLKGIPDALQRFNPPSEPSVEGTGSGIEKQKVDDGIPSEGTPTTEDAFRVLAQKQIDEQIKQKNADLDLQIKQATENRDFSAAEQLKAYKNAIRDVQNQAFLSGQGITQGMANRGLLNSGMYSDALLRAGMGSQQQIRQLAQKQQSSIDKAMLGYNQTLEKINKAKADLASGSVKDVQALTKQLIADQQSADKYKADILKAQADKNSADAKQVFDYVQLLAKENNYDISGLLPYAINGDVEGMTNWLQRTGNLKMSQAGREIEANIMAKKADIGVSQSQKAENLAQAAGGWSDIFGIAMDANGRPVADKNGNVIPTQSAKEASAKLLQQARDSELSRSIAAQGNALGWAKLSDLQDYRDDKFEQDDKKLKLALDKDKQKSTADYYKMFLDDSRSRLNNTSSALANNPNDKRLQDDYTVAASAYASAKSAMKKYYEQTNQPEIASQITIPDFNFTKESFNNLARDSGMGTSKSGK